MSEIYARPKRSEFTSNFEEHYSRFSDRFNKIKRLQKRYKLKILVAKISAPQKYYEYEKKFKYRKSEVSKELSEARRSQDSPEGKMGVFGSAVPHSLFYLNGVEYTILNLHELVANFIFEVLGKNIFDRHQRCTKATHKIIENHNKRKENNDYK